MILPPWLYAAGAAVGLVGAFGAGWTVQGWRCSAARSQALESAITKAKAQLDRVGQQSTTYEKGKADAAVVTIQNEREIRTIYKDRVVSPDCAVLPAARGLLEQARIRANAASRGEPGATVP